MSTGARCARSKTLSSIIADSIVVSPFPRGHVDPINYPAETVSLSRNFFFFLFFFFEDFETKKSIRSEKINICRYYMVSFIIINYQNFIQIFDLDVNQILSLLYIIFSIFSKETARNSILSNQPNISIRLLSWCIVTKQGVERKASFTIVTQASAHEPFPRGQGTDVADSSPRNPPSPSTAKLFVVKADFSRTK